MNKQKEEMEEDGGISRGEQKVKIVRLGNAMLVWYRIVNGADMPAWSAACYY